MILHVRSSTRFGKMIRYVLGSWGNHDGLLWQDSDGAWYVLESVSPWATKTPLRAYEDAMDDGWTFCRVYWPIGAMEDQGAAACDWWLRYVDGTFYDWAGIARLAIKAAFGDWIRRAAGWEWAHWCTEGVADAWRLGGRADAWRKINPTPLTTEHRVGGALVDLTSCHTQAHSKTPG
jgi:hypothetical protein